MWAKVLGEIRRARTVLVTTHANPDGDALGSALALAMGLKKLKKKVTVYNKDTVPLSLKFLPKVELVTQTLDPKAHFDIALIADCAEMNRVSDEFARHPGIGKRIVIDHHANSRMEGDLNLVEGCAAASGSVVFKVLQKLRVPMTREIATCIYCALVTDTGNFRYSNTDAETFELAQKLVIAGVQPWEVTKPVYENFPVERLKLLGRSLGSLQVLSGGRIATIELTEAMLRETNATKDMAEDFINFPRSINTVEVAVQFRETEEGWKMSLRSKDYVDVAAICRKFGGGGHARAAGFTDEGTLDQIRTKVLEEIEKVLEEEKSLC